MVLVASILLCLMGTSLAQAQPARTGVHSVLSGMQQQDQVQQPDGVVRLVFFYAQDCPHCLVVAQEVLEPLQQQYAGKLLTKSVEISTPDGYKLLLDAEALYGIAAEQRGLPTLILGDQVLIGEDAIRQQLIPLVERNLMSGGTAWPPIPSLDSVTDSALDAQFSGLGQAGLEPCEADVEDSCDVEAPGPEPAQAAIWIAYFYQTGCQSCDRARHDLAYVQSLYPQIRIDEYNVQENAALAEWLASEHNLPDRLHLATPSLFVGQDYLVGTDINTERLSALVARYAASGATRAWSSFDAEAAQQGILHRFEGWSVLTVAAAGLIDGLNPCAFATLIFFVSYLSLSGRKGRQVLAVGAAFASGVFLAYLMVGIGFWKVLDLLGETVTTLGRWVYGFTALVCAALAVLGLVDFFKARRGEIGDMALNLPHALRLRINAVIRHGRRSRAFVAGAFVTGVLISFLELACTGQVYLPTIIFAVSQAQTPIRALAYLLLYNLLFIAPLIVVFVLVYHGTGSKQLTRFLQQRAAWVKLGLAGLFAVLASWLALSIVA